MSGHVFISYSQFDQDYVTALSAYLEQAGIPVWYDYRVTTGSRFDAVIQESIDSCAAFIFVVSPNSLQSAWVDREMGYADDQGKPIFPLVLGAGGRLPIRLQNLHFEDVSDGRMPGPDTIARLQALTRATAAPPPADATPPSSSRTGEYPSYARPTPHRGQPVYAPARQRSRVPVYASVLVSVAAVSVAATFALLFLRGSPEQGEPLGDRADAGGMTTSVETTSPGTPAEDLGADQARDIDTLLNESAAGRAALAVALADINACIISANTLENIHTAIDSRSSLINRLDGTAVNNLPDGAGLKADLREALVASYDADVAYLNWVQAAGGGCPSTGHSTFTPVNLANSRATAAKAAFVAAWNPVARQYGLPSRTAGEI
jgi:hypothetical protein